MTGSRVPPRGKCSLDRVYLTLLVSTSLGAGIVILFLGPDSWFHRNRSEAFSLLFVAIGVIALVNLRIAAAHGKIWGKVGSIHRTDHPWLFRTHRTVNRIVVFASAAGIVALRFFLPPLG